MIILMILFTFFFFIFENIFHEYSTLYPNIVETILKRKNRKIACSLIVSKM